MGHTHGAYPCLVLGVPMSCIGLTHVLYWAYPCLVLGVPMGHTHVLYWAYPCLVLGVPMSCIGLTHVLYWAYPCLTHLSYAVLALQADAHRQIHRMRIWKSVDKLLSMKNDIIQLCVHLRHI